jgi:hypothetical protein
MKNYSEIDLNETPIVVLGCGHFFTAETLDGLMGMAEVYVQDGYGEFTGLQDVSGVLARSIPRCPDCQCPVRQYSIQRYNRVINRAVIDEMSKRFLVDGKTELGKIEQQVVELEQSFESSREEILQTIRDAEARHIGQFIPTETLQITQKLKDRYLKSRIVEKAIQNFREKSANKHQPAQKLHDATVNAARRGSIDEMMKDLNIANSIPAIPRDRRVTMGGRLAQLQAECIVLADKFSLAQNLKSARCGGSMKISGGSPDQLVKPFFRACKAFFDDSSAKNLPKLCVEASLYYVRIAWSNQSYCSSTKAGVDKSLEAINTAKELLEMAKGLCAQPFQNADVLLTAVEEWIKLLGKERYEEVTKEEIAAIKAAMVSGPGGIITHSGHWYNCINGHPVSLNVLFSLFFCTNY